jgi:hypothetical protein
VHNTESVFGLIGQSEENNDISNKENCDVVSTAGSIISMGAESVNSVATCTTDMLGIT